MRVDLYDSVWTLWHHDVTKKKHTHPCYVSVGLIQFVSLIAVFKSQKVEIECEEAMCDTLLKLLPIG